MSGIGIAVAVVGLLNGSSPVTPSVVPKNNSFPIERATGKSLEIVSQNHWVQFEAHSMGGIEERAKYKGKYKHFTLLETTIIFTQAENSDISVVLHPS